MGRPAGRPSTVETSACPCDSPAVRKRSINRRFYTPVGRGAGRRYRPPMALRRAAGSRTRPSRTVVLPAARGTRGPAQNSHSHRRARANRAGLSASRCWRGACSDRGMHWSGRPVAHRRAPLRAIARDRDGSGGPGDGASGCSGEPADRREAASAWTSPAPGTASGGGGHVVLDAWLTQDWLGRWTERVVTIAAADPPWTPAAPAPAWEALSPGAIGVDAHDWRWRVVPARRRRTRCRHRAGAGAMARRARRCAGCAVAAAADRWHGRVAGRGRSERGIVGEARRSGVDAGRDQRLARGLDRRHAAAVASVATDVAPRHARAGRPRATTASCPARGRPRAALSFVGRHPAVRWRS